jgi:hypothetical protein
MNIVSMVHADCFFAREVSHAVAFLGKQSLVRVRERDAKHPPEVDQRVVLCFQQPVLVCTGNLRGLLIQVLRPQR